MLCLIIQTNIQIFASPSFAELKIFSIIKQNPNITFSITVVAELTTKIYTPDMH